MSALRLAVVAAVAVQGLSAAAAPPLAVRHARTIHVSLGGRGEDAMALKATPIGWRLELGGSLAGTTASLRDVTTAGASPTRYELSVTPTGVVLDTNRFRADHAYRLEVRRGTIVVGSALIYLSPPPRGNGRVVFDDGDARSASSSDDELATSDKGTL